MNKILITIISLAFLAGASDESENLFIQGHAYELQGQDSLACIYYERALQADSASLTLQLLLGKELIRANRQAEGLQVLRKVADTYAGKKEWVIAAYIFKTVFDITKCKGDGYMAVLMLYKSGQITLEKAEEAREKLTRFPL